MVSIISRDHDFIKQNKTQYIVVFDQEVHESTAYRETCISMLKMCLKLKQRITFKKHFLVNCIVVGRYTSLKYAVLSAKDSKI